MDMYSRVKRVRRRVKRDMYGIPINDAEVKGTESSPSSEEDSCTEDVSTEGGSKS